MILTVAGGYGWLQAAGAQPAQKTIDFADVDVRTTEGAAIASLVRQQMLYARTSSEFKPQAPTTRGELAIAVQKLFSLPPAERGGAATNFPDIQLGTRLDEAVRGIAPYLNRQILCPGCALGSNFIPDDTPSRAEMAVLLVSVLVSQRRIQLVGAVERDQILSAVTGTGDLSPLARTYVATALKHKLLSLGPSREAALDEPVRRGELAVQLFNLQQRFHLEP